MAVPNTFHCHACAKERCDAEPGNVMPIGVHEGTYQQRLQPLAIIYECTDCHANYEWTQGRGLHAMRKGRIPDVWTKP
jgi:hypothetical protein